MLNRVLLYTTGPWSHHLLHDGASRRKLYTLYYGLSVVTLRIRVRITTARWLVCLGMCWYLGVQGSQDVAGRVLRDLSKLSTSPTCQVIKGPLTLAHIIEASVQEQSRVHKFMDGEDSSAET